MIIRGMIRRLSFFVAWIAFASIASAQYGDFSLSGGYSHLFPDHTGGLFFDKDGEYVDANFAFRIPDVAVPVYAGLGLSGSGYWESQDGPYFINNNGFGYNERLYSDVENFEIEPRLAVKLVIPGLRNFYVRPQIGAGLMINNYSVDQAQTANNVVFINTLYHTGAAFEIHPNVEAGWQLGPGSIGFELGYLAAWGGFGGLGSNVQELRVGVFGRFRF